MAATEREGKRPLRAQIQAGRGGGGAGGGTGRAEGSKGFHSGRSGVVSDSTGVTGAGSSQAKLMIDEVSDASQHLISKDHPAGGRKGNDGQAWDAADGQLHFQYGEEGWVEGAGGRRLRDSNGCAINGDDDIDEKTATNVPFVFLLTAIAAIGGFLFGYDTGVVSGAMLKVKDEFDLTDEQQECVVSVTIASAIVGALLGGPASHQYGRWKSIVFAATTFTIGAGVMGVASGYEMLVVGRLIVGFGIGIASLVTPVYISEAAPPHLRGKLLTVNTLLITFGQVIACMVDGLFADVPQGWRYMLGLSGVPSVLMLVGFCFLPESPRWLAQKGQVEKAVPVLQRIRGTLNVWDELDEVVYSAEEHGDKHYTIFDLFAMPVVRRALALGCGLQLLQQLSGINTVMYYSASIFRMAGFPVNTSIWLAALSALSQSTGVVCGLYLIEHAGRRPLILVSLALVTVFLGLLGGGFFIASIESARALTSSNPVDDECTAVENVFLGTLQVDSCYSCVQIANCGFCDDAGVGATDQIYTSGKQQQQGICFAIGSDDGGGGGGDTDALGRCDVTNDATWYDDHCPKSYGWIPLTSLMLYLLSFGIGMSSVPWTVNAEIYPMHVRSICTSLSTAVNWIANVGVSATFLTLASPHVLGKFGAFWLYCLIALIGWCWLFMVMPETKGLSLEEIEKLFEKPGDEVKLKVKRRTRKHGAQRLGDYDNDDDDGGGDDGAHSGGGGGGGGGEHPHNGDDHTACAQDDGDTSGASSRSGDRHQVLL